MLDIRFYNSSNERLTVPENAVYACSFEEQERGGYTMGTVSILAQWDDADLAGLLANCKRVDIRDDDGESFLWRGYTGNFGRSGDQTGEEAEFTFYGVMANLNTLDASVKIVKSAGADVSKFVQFLIDLFLIKSDGVTTEYAIPSLTLTDIETIGISADSFDLKGLTFAAAMDALCEFTAGAAVWGVETNGATPVPNDILYFRRRPTETLYKPSIGGALGSWSYTPDAAGIVNKLYIMGGKVSQPNLIRDGSFEEPTAGSETSGNQLADYSFEAPGTPDWTGIGGVTVQTSPPGSAHTGSAWLECDTAGEGAEQTLPVDYDVAYTARCWARRETAANVRNVIMEVVGLDAGSSPVHTFSQTFTPAGETYERFDLAVNFSSYPTVTQATFRVKTDGGSASNDGVCIDDCGFFEGVVNPSWRFDVAGAATRTSIIWNYRDPFNQWHGGLCVKAQAGSIGGPSDWMEIRTDRSARFELKPNTLYSALIRYKAVTGLDTVDLKLAVEEFQRDGSSLGTTVDPASSNTSTQWNTAHFTFTTNAAAAQGEFIVRLRSEAAVTLDGAMLIEGYFAADAFAVKTYPPDPYDTSPVYWEGDTYQAVILASDIRLADGALTEGRTISAEAAASLSTYGYHAGPPISQPGVTEERSLLAFAVSYFNRYAVPVTSGADTLTEPEILVRPNGLLKVVNLASAPPAMLPNRVTTEMGQDGFIRQTVDLDSGHPDMTDFLRITERNARNEIIRSGR